MGIEPTTLCLASKVKIPVNPQNKRSKYLIYIASVETSLIAKNSEISLKTRLWPAKTVTVTAEDIRVFDLMCSLDFSLNSTLSNKENYPLPTPERKPYSGQKCLTERNNEVTVFKGEPENLGLAADMPGIAIF